MECQVNVAQDSGTRVEGDYKGKQWHGWTDGYQTWKPFRIPWGANSTPTFDKESSMSFDFENHVLGVGMSGWDWEAKVSRWVAFDFDGIVGHAVGLTVAEMDAVLNQAQQIEWITVRKSTSGGGIHLYVFLDDIATATHTEHAALARAILGQMSALSGFDFTSKVDTCGGNMWVWHRKMKGTDGLTLIKQGIKLLEPPPNWKDHVPVIKNTRRKNLPQVINSSEEDLFEELTGQRSNVKLDSKHREFINYLKENNALWWWDNDHHMLVTHTHWLTKAFEDLNMSGIFKTNTDAKNINEQNCFMFPLSKGSWIVRRFSRGAQEADSWDQDTSGWTRCYFNKQPDLTIASRTFSGVELEKGGFVFNEAEMAAKAMATLGAHIDLPSWATQRKTELKRHKDGRLIVKIKREDTDKADDMRGWLTEKGNWKRIYNAQVQDISEPETAAQDDFIRHLTTSTGDDYGWTIKTDAQWRTEPLQHIKLTLKAMGYNAKDTESLLGNSVLKCWELVNLPFQDQYPGDRKWNRNAAQFMYKPTEELDNLKYPSWELILNHCGEGLNEAIKGDNWCSSNSIVCGADYLKCWISAIFQEPLEPLPYLFMYGPQNSGKSIFHEAMSLLLTRGYVRADHAIESQSGFNGELENAIVCIIEETNLSQSKTAYNRIKDWVTSRQINIRKMYHTPYHVPNSTHWIQCANDIDYCPVFSGDTRITLCFVDSLDLDILIPKRELIARLIKEAPDFMASCIHLEIPKSRDRLNLPVITTGDKEQMQQLNSSPLECFLEECCHYIQGEIITIADFFREFNNWIDPDEAQNWSKIVIGKRMPTKFPKGRQRDGTWIYGNIAFQKIEATKPKLVLKQGKLVSVVK